jgi:rhamnose transport system ATP-binding protein
MRALAEDELPRLKARLPGMEERLRLALLPRDAADARPAILEIRPGTGGEEAALFAGLEQASGDAVIPIDVDLQDPVEVIPMLIEQWRAGFDVVLAKRRDRSCDSYLKRFTAAGFYCLLNCISQIRIEENVGDFRLLDRKVVEVIKSMPEQQLVEIACALGSGARIVIMDEPTASLTQKEQHLLFAVVRDLRAAGVGIIYISHRLEEIFALADRVTVLRDGESVGTHAVGDINESGLIRLMVGREVAQVYPPSESAPAEVVLTLTEVGCAESGVHHVSLEVRRGEILGLAGLVGAGRTELARVLFGLTPADAGEIRLHGQAVTLRSPRDAVDHGIAYVPEDRRRHGVVLELPVAQNLTMAIHRTLFRGAWLRPRAEQELALEYIRELAIKTAGTDAPAGSLSGGNQQKVSLGRWLATKPKLLILDEPTQGVDVGAKSEIHRIIRRLARDGLAVLLISSDLPEILGMSDRIGVMRAGTLAAVLPGGSDAHTVMAAALGQAGKGNAA